MGFQLIEEVRPHMDLLMKYALVMNILGKHDVKKVVHTSILVVPNQRCLSLLYIRSWRSCTEIIKYKLK